MIIDSCQQCQFLFNSKRKPFILSCKHTFCIKCLIKEHGQVDLNDVQLQITSKKTKCPSCGEKSVANYDTQTHEKIIEKNRNNDADRIINISFFGEMNVGKTSLINRLAKDTFSQHVMTTVGFGFSSVKKQIQQNIISYQFFDTAGQQKYRSLTPLHFKKADIAFIVFDSSLSVQQNRLNYWISQVEQKCSTKKIYLIGNKIDLIDDFETNESLNWAKNIKDTKDWPFYMISCKSGIGLAELWRILNKSALTQKYKLKSSSMMLHKEEKSQISSNTKTKAKKCC